MALADRDLQRQVARLRRDLEKILHFSGESPNVDFLISSLTEYNPFNSTEEIVTWLENRRAEECFQVETIPLSDLRRWYFDPSTGDLAHESSGFFAIRGLEVRTNIGPIRYWTQPIIDQPKVGLLGLITQKINGLLYLLMQAKAEPGNVNVFQLAPTVQATRSNYLRVHGGRDTRFLEYFLDDHRARVLFDQHQSEQGARFYRKRNRNMIVQIPEGEKLDPGPNFRWVTLGQLKRLMLRDNTVNMDARSVLASICFCPEMASSTAPLIERELHEGLQSSPLVFEPLSPLKCKLLISVCSNLSPICSLDELLRRLSREKFIVELETHLRPLKEVKGWIVSPQEIRHEKNLYFSVLGVRVQADNREVRSWDQPIVKQQHPGIVGFIMREIEGVIHFLVQLKMESGNIDLLGMAPTVQCITGSYEVGDLPPYVGEMLKPAQTSIVFDTMQSEEGGRFYYETNRNLLLLGQETFPLEAPPRYLWVSYRQLKQLLMFSNFLNVETRSLLAII